MNEHDLKEGCCGYQIHHTGECCQTESDEKENSTTEQKD
jgi:hypothetical protein